MRDVSAHPDRIRHLLEVFTERLRHMDDMVMALAFSPKRKRLEFALGLARLRTIPDRKHAGQQVFKGEPSDLASSAAVDEAEARRFLDRASEKRGAEVFAEDDSVSALGNSVAHLAGGAARRVSTPAPRTLVAIGPPFFGLWFVKVLYTLCGRSLNTLTRCFGGVFLAAPNSALDNWPPRVPKSVEFLYKGSATRVVKSHERTDNPLIFQEPLIRRHESCNGLLEPALLTLPGWLGLPNGRRFTANRCRQQKESLRAHIR